jgi:hypothetical protein
MSDTAEDIRHKVSPQHIKSEVSDYISRKTQSWVEALKQHAMDNPMRAVAAGTAVAVPLLRLARGFPLPLLMISAGLARTSKTVRDRASEAAAPVMDTAGEMLDEARERAGARGPRQRTARPRWNQHFALRLPRVVNFRRRAPQCRARTVCKNYFTTR